MAVIVEKTEAELAVILANVQATRLLKAEKARERKTLEEMRTSSRPLVHRLNLKSFGVKE
jgi:hypothetical protein